MMSQIFHIGDILSITTERLVSPNHMDGIYKILNFMTGDELFTHQLPRASKECKPFLIKQMPWLNEISSKEVNQENWEAWLAEIIQKYGEFHKVEQISSEKHLHIDPLTELQQMTSAKIIPIILED